MRLQFCLLALLVASSIQAQSYSFNKKVTATPRSLTGRFGFRVAVDSNFAAISQITDLHRSSDTSLRVPAGSISMYEWNKLESEWRFTQKLEADSVVDLNFFGWSIDIYDNIMLVGTVGERLNPYQANEKRSVGAVYVFRREDNGEWVQLQKLWHYERDEAQNFGDIVKLNGRDALIYSERYRGTTAWEDKVDHYRLNENDTLVHVGTLKTPDNVSNNYFIGNIELSHNQAFVSGLYQRDTNSRSVVDVYRLNEELEFDHKQTIESPSDTPNYVNDNMNMVLNDQFGYEIEANDENLIISAPRHREGQERTGAVYYYRLNSSESWWLAQTIYPEIPEYSAEFGNQITMHDNKLLVSAPFQILAANDSIADSLDDAGRIFYYQLDRYKQWTLQQNFVHVRPQEAERFGTDMDVFGEHLVIGAPFDFEDENEENTLSLSGSAYFYRDPIEECPQDLEIFAYPNPNYGDFTVCTSDSIGIMDLHLYNTLGQEVPLYYEYRNKCVLAVIDSYHYASGIYILKAFTGYQYGSVKIKIQRREE